MKCYKCTKDLFKDNTAICSNCERQLSRVIPICSDLECMKSSVFMKDYSQVFKDAGFDINHMMYLFCTECQNGFNELNNAMKLDVLATIFEKAMKANSIVTEK